MTSNYQAKFFAYALTREGGKGVERLDLYARLKLPQKDILREVRRLSVRISRTNLQYAQADIDRLMALATAGETAYDEIVTLVDGLVKI